MGVATKFGKQFATFVVLKSRLQRRVLPTRAITSVTARKTIFAAARQSLPPHHDQFARLRHPDNLQTHATLTHPEIWTTYPRACEICRGLLKGLIDFRIPSPQRVVAKHCTSEPSRPRSEPTACGQIILLQFLALAGCVAGSLEQRCSTRPLVHCGRAALRDASSQTPESFQTAPCCTRGRQAR